MFDHLEEMIPRVKELEELLEYHRTLTEATIKERDRLRERLDHERHQRWVESGKMGDLVKEVERLQMENKRLNEERPRFRRAEAEVERLRGELDRKESERVYIWEKGELLCSREYVTGLQAENERLRSKLTVLEAREEAFQKERAEVERLRRIEQAAQSVCYGPFEELDGPHRNLYRALEGNSDE